MYMTGNSKVLLLAGSGAFCVVLALLCFGPSGGPRFRAESIIIVRPYTNAVFTRSFEAHIIRTVPGVIRLWVTPGFSAIPRPGVTVITNSAAIHIISIGSTANDAQRAANDAAQRLCRVVLADYAATADIVQAATTARRYSFFHDRLQDGIIRWFKR
jgi:hypothetical protein